MKHFHHNTLARRIAAAVIAFAVAVVAFPIAAAAAPEGKVNVNTADADALALLPRVGPALAQRILDYREDNGVFEAAEDLMLVRGIGEKTFELMEPWVTLKGDTTLTEKVRTSDARKRAESGGDDGR
jgi:competence protein ComEA